MQTWVGRSWLHAWRDRSRGRRARVVREWRRHGTIGEGQGKMFQPCNSARGLEKERRGETHDTPIPSIKLLVLLAIAVTL